MSNLSENEKKKYVRQIILDNVGIKGQEKLKESKILVVGSGGLGSSVLYYLASSGVGTLGIIDKDLVEYSNLNRQIIHFEKDVGKSKTQSAKEKLSLLNKDITINTYQFEINSLNAESIIADYDFIVEASDNFETKFLVNDTCVKLGKAFTIAGVMKFEGQIMTVIPKFSACYRCVFSEIPEPGTYPNSCELGIMGTTAGFFGIIEANEAIKYILFNDSDSINDKLLVNKILYVDLESNLFDTIIIQKNEECTACGKAKKHRYFESLT